MHAQGKHFILKEAPKYLAQIISTILQYQWTSGGLQTPSFDSNVYDDYVLQDNCLVKREPISHLTREQLEEKSKSVIL